MHARDTKASKAGSPCKGFSEGIGRNGRQVTMRTLAEMGRPVAILLYGVAMAAVIVGVDLVFFRNLVWERLIVNIGIVSMFAAFYLKFLKRS
jgi:hypothetical protein